MSQTEPSADPVRTGFMRKPWFFRTNPGEQAADEGTQLYVAQERRDRRKRFDLQIFKATNNR